MNKTLKCVSKGIVKYGATKTAPKAVNKIASLLGRKAASTAATSSAMATIGTPISLAFSALGITVAPSVAGSIVVSLAAGFIVDKLFDAIFE